LLKQPPLKSFLLYSLLIFSFICLTSCNKSLAVLDKDLTGLEYIPLEKKRAKGNNDYKLLEETWKARSRIIKEYTLVNPQGKAIYLDIRVDHKSEILFYEFLDNFLFILFNKLAPIDAVEFKVFDLESGKEVLSDGGQLPCANSGKAGFSWNFEDDKCYWIHPKDKQLAYARKGSRKIEDAQSQSLENYIFSFNWATLTKDTISIIKSTSIDPVTKGYVELNDIKYNRKERIFEIED